ncbi:MAG: response regulator [Desulfovibrionaceae bacterium]
MTLDRIRLLILDDEERIRQLLRDYLEDYDEFDVRVAGSGEAALAELAREPADVAVVDMRLPGMNGERFIVEAVRDGLCGHFLLHTGSSGLSVSEGLRDLGLTDRDVFFKPADPARILARLRELSDLEE